MNGKKSFFLFLWLSVFLIVAALNYFVKRKALQDIHELRKVVGASGQIRLEYRGK